MTERDEATEAIRQAVNALPKFSFLLNGSGGVSRRRDRSGQWVSVDAVRELLDPQRVDALLAEMREQRAATRQ